MAYKIIEAFNSEWRSEMTSDSHTTFRCEFRHAGTLVDVNNIEFSIHQVTPGGTDVTANVTMLKYLQKISDEDSDCIGKYETTYIPRSLIADEKYYGVATGKYNPGSGEVTITVEKEMIFRSINRIQWFIEMLKGSLKDKYNYALPHKFYLHAPQEFEWKEGELYEHLIRAIDDINWTAPFGVSNFDLQSIPIINLPLIGAQIYALLSKGIFEVSNYYSYNGPTKVDLYKGDKYSIYADKLLTEYKTRIKEFKQYYVWKYLSSHIITYPRIPFRIVRPLSDVLYWSSAFGF